MAKLTPKQQKRARRKANIISAAIDLLADRGFLALKMSDVAGAAGCSMGAVYSHFVTIQHSAKAYYCNSEQP